MLDIADALEENEDLIKVENDADIAAALNAGYEKAILSHLALKPGKASTCSLYISIHKDILPHPVLPLFFLLF